MKRADKAARIAAILDSLYPEPRPPLSHDDPFTLLVAVLLSAQTTDVRVNRVTPELFRRAPDAAAMVRLGADRILPLIRSCGLAPTKAKNIARLARQLVEQHQGRVPQRLEQLEMLPGVGHKTASVVMIHAFNQPAFPVDTHIHRLARRWALSRARTVAQTEEDLKKLYPPARWAKRHLQIIFFGREYCPARGHELSSCPICSWAASKRQVAAEARGGRTKAVKRRKARR